MLRSHLRLCSDCRRFDEDVTWQTGELRSAPLESVVRPVSVPRRGWSRRAIEIDTATTAALAAAIALVIGIGGSHSRPAVVQTPAPFVQPTLGFDNESRGLPRATAVDREHGVNMARGRRALPQL